MKLHAGTCAVWLKLHEFAVDHVRPGCCGNPIEVIKTLEAVSHMKLGTAMYVAASVGFLLLMGWLFSDEIAERHNPNQNLDSQIAPAGAASVTLQRNRQGHYVASGSINNSVAELMLDTGATDVAVSARVAERAGLERGRIITVSTANGPAQAYSTVIKRLQLGAIVEHEVRATIVPTLGEIDVLLGMSFLKRLDFAQRGDMLVLTSRRAAPHVNRHEP